MIKLINIVTVNFNTLDFTDILIRSINKFTPGANIYVWDNSDKTPFVNIYDNVKVLDNTKGQLLDLDKFLEEYPDRVLSGECTGNFGSARHARTILEIINIFDFNFLLVDSDICLKKDVSSLCDDNYLFVGSLAETKGLFYKRIHPALCYINVKLMKEHNIKYFDGKEFCGLHKKLHPSYDTGGSFLVESIESGLPYKMIKMEDYCNHFGSGSWKKYEKKMIAKQKFIKESNNIINGVKDKDNNINPKKKKKSNEIKNTKIKDKKLNKNKKQLFLTDIIFNSEKYLF